MIPATMDKLYKPTLVRDYTLFSQIIIVLVLIVTGWFIWNFYVSEQRQIVQRIAAQAKQLERSFVDDIRYTSYQMEYILSEIKHNPSDLSFIHKTLSVYKSDHKVHNVISWNMFSWADAKKHIVVDGELGILKESRSLETRDYIPRTIEEPRKIHLGQPVFGAVSRRWIIPAGMGDYDHDGNYMGAIVFGFDVNGLRTKFREVLPVEGLKFFLVDTRHWKVLVESVQYQHIASQSEILNLLQSHVSGGTLSGALYVPGLFDRSEHYSYALQVEGQPFAIVVSYDKTLGEQRLRDMLSPRLIEFFLIGVAVLAALFFARQRLITPIVELSDNAAMLAVGGDNVQFRTDYNHTEISNLAHQLAKVAGYVKELKRIDCELMEKTIAAESANRAKSEFMAGVSHELRTPLNAIIGYSEMMKAEMFGSIENERYLRYIEDIHDSSLYLLRNINDVLSVARLESNLVSIERTPVQINRLIHECINILSPGAENNTITITTDLVPEVDDVLVDQHRFKHVVLNVLSNAIKFTDAGGSVTITTSIEEGIFVIEIADTGIGMTPDELASVQQNFYQADSGLNRRFEGIGLGLSLARKLIALHGGSLEMHSEKYQGTTVRIITPYEKDDS